MQIDTDNLIRNLILEQCQATEQEITQIITHVAQQSVSSALRKMNLWLREELDILGIQTPPGKLPSAQLHLFKSID